MTKIDPELEAHALQVARDQWGEAPSPKPLREALANMVDRPTDHIHSHAPWTIARYQSRMRNTALDSLSRSGFECWSPGFKSFTQTPLRKIPPKKRHLAKLYLTQRFEERFPGYIFIRQITGHYDLNRLFDLKGCGGVVTVGGTPAKVPDFDIEIMRLDEVDGRYDIYSWKSVPIGLYRIDALPESSARDQWTGCSPLNGRLDDSGKTILSVDVFGRVSKLIAQADAI